MTLILSLAVRNAARNVIRTGLTVMMVVLGTATIALLLAWLDGIFGDMVVEGSNAVGHVRIVDEDYAAREILMPLYENVPDARPIVDAVKAVPGVSGVYPRVVTGVTLTAGEEIGDVFGLAVGADDAWFREGLALQDKVVAGHWFSGEPGEVVLGRKLVERTGAKVGDEILVLGATQDGSPSAIKAELVGVVAAGNALIDQQVWLPLERMQYLADIPGGATEVLVQVDDLDEAAAVAERLRALPALAGYRVEAWTERTPWNSILQTVTVMRSVLLGIVVFITALGIWNTMMMSVLERTDEIGVLRAMGLGRAGAVALFVLEASFIAVLGGLGGVTIGGLAGLYLEKVGWTLGEQLTQMNALAMPQTLYADVTVASTVTSFVLGLLMAVLGSALPAIRAAAIQPVAAMRSGR